MLILAYALSALLVILLSLKLSNYVDLLDKQTNLSGAFLGGVLLAAVTSLPELFTSISSVVFLDEPEMVVGNILGSNLFNVAALSMVSLLGFKIIRRRPVAASHAKTVLFTLAIYALLAVLAADLFHIYLFGINIASVLIVILYVLGVKTLSGEDSSESVNDAAVSGLTPRQILMRFAFLSLCLVLVSIGLTVITDKISQTYNLGASFAGAVFLGVATSLPELVSTSQLVRLGNYNAACGNILGSNLFNFTILAIADFLYTAGTVYIFGYQSMVLLVCGIAASLVMMIYVRSNSRGRRLGAAKSLLLLLAGVLCYVSFLLLTV